jgi:PAS domain S-box-containing protein
MASSKEMLAVAPEIAEFPRGPAFDSVDVGIVVLDGNHCIVGWNDWIERAAKLSRADALGKGLLEVFPGARETRLPAAIGDALEIGCSSVLSHSLNPGLPLWGDSNQPLLHNILVRPAVSAGSSYCLLQINDVTLSVNRERVLRERQNARYHAIVDAVPDAIITTDPDRRIQWINSAAEHVFGYAASELLGKEIDILLGQQGALSSMFAAPPGVRQVSLQVSGRRKQGAPGLFDVSFGRWKVEERTFITTIWRDVTERVAANAALRDSESRHRALLEALPQLVWTCGADGECDYFNPQWGAYTGVPEEQHHGWRWLTVIHESDCRELTAAWNFSLETGNVFDVDARLRARDGAYRWFKMRSIPVLAQNGRIARWFGTATDITDLVEARNALRRSNEELEARVAERTQEREAALRQVYEFQKMESIGQLTGGVAHDFNNLLAVILGSLALLKKSLPDDPRTSRFLDRAIQGAERGATLTARLLAFARRQDLRHEVVELQRRIPEMLDFLRHSVGPNVSIELDISPDVRPVEVDPNQLELALINLAVNARDAMPQGGSLAIACHNIAGSESPGGGSEGGVCISVADAGEGMSEDTLARALEPFFTTKGVGKGTGLGLSMVHGFTAQSGGTMRIASQPGKGTVVMLCLPQAPERRVSSAPPKEPDISQEQAADNLRVLLVDDDVLVSMGAADMLMDLGHTVIEAASAASALKLLASEPPFDVVITDYAMPGMNGLDLALRIQLAHPALPVIIATGYAELPAHDAAGFRRLAKPYTQSALAAALRTVLTAR